MEFYKGSDFGTTGWDLTENFSAFMQKIFGEMLCNLTFLREIAYYCKFIVFTEFIAKN